MLTLWKSVVLLAGIEVSAVLGTRPALAGCGCDKPPPPPAEVRPNATYAGTPISLFSPTFQLGQNYTVTFASALSGQTAAVLAQADSRRDLADGQYKPQLVVALPRLPLGPVSIIVTEPGSGGEVAFVPDTDFTVVPPPVIVPAQPGAYLFKNFQAAVGRDGVVYLSLDMSNVTQPLVIDAQAIGYPLRFSDQGVVFRNTQGFLMQLLTQAGKKGSSMPIPGMFVLPASTTNATSRSDLLRYSRHEFETYFLQHQERQPHALDPTDANWHVDGTRHVDHNHLILTITGHLNDGSLPVVGATAPFTLSCRSYSLFYQGLVGSRSVRLSGGATTDSYSTQTLNFGSKGDVFSNGPLGMTGNAKVNGDATAKVFNILGGASITGVRTRLTTPSTFMTVKVPPALVDLGKIDLKKKDDTFTVTGPGSFRAQRIAVKNGATLFIDNSAGPVTLYVGGSVAMSGSGSIQTADPDPEKFALYVTTSNSVSLSGGSSFHGVVYAPNSAVSISDQGDFFGAFVGYSVKLSHLARAHYEESLRGH